MDKSWMFIQNRVSSTEYKEGVKSFLDFAMTHLGQVDVIRCPCVDCENREVLGLQLVKFHLLWKGISTSYKTWIYHGETVPISQPHVSPENEYSGGEGNHGTAGDEVEDRDELPTMVEDVCRGLFMDDDIDDFPPIDDVLRFDKLLNHAQRPLYPGCETTVFEFVIKMLHLKVHNKLSNIAYNMNMNLFKSVLPKCEDIVPWTLYEAKKFLLDLGLGYEAIHACMNDCVLFWKENANLENCPRCQEPRYKDRKIPYKVLRYFPLTPRLKRLYMSRKTATDMRWHKDNLVDDGTLRHPADGEEWKNFDKRFPEFATDPRNVRLGIATDGFNPFGNMSTSYSMWPVIVLPYNLPPWKCMKQPFSLMSLLIPGPSAPGRNIDVYLRPLIDELKELWLDGVKTYDALSECTFAMHAAVLWTINDFPAYGNMSGWTTKGYKTCPICNEDPSSQPLVSKIGYTGARHFLQEDHIWRRSRLFNGKYENRSRPVELTGEQILDQIDSGTYMPFGKPLKGKKRPREANPGSNWTKRSIFFELPYWKTLNLRHNLDVMHIEKNICDNLVGTLLDIKGKNKDTKKARVDLQKMKIRKEFHLRRRDDGKLAKPLALYTLSSERRQGFRDFVGSIKYPDGYAANLSNCVNTEGGKLSGLRSHDCHVLLQRLLPIGMRGYLPKEILIPLFELGNFFQQLCAKTIKLEDLGKLENQIIQILCKFEKIFPPAFFDVMVHLAIHLPHEIRLGGPVQYRWMYPIERLLGVLKGFVSNKARPEGSIVEAYIAKECTTFCLMYLQEVETIFNREERNADGGSRGGKLVVFTQPARLFGLLSRAPDVRDNERQMTHWFVLHNSTEIDHYLQAQKALLHKVASSSDITKRQAKEFPNWFKNHMNQLRSQRATEATDELWALANGLIGIVNLYSGCFANGYRFHTLERDSRCKSQNSGLLVEGEGHTTSFYGRLCMVWEMTYLFGYRVILFQCERYNTGSSRTFRDEPHSTSINVTSRWFKDDPFVLPSQVQQVFYVNDTLLGDNWRVVEKYRRRGIWDVPEKDELQSNDNEDVHIVDEAFQQDGTYGVVPIDIEGLADTPLNRSGEEVIQDKAVLEAIDRALAGDVVGEDNMNDNEDNTSDDEDEDDDDMQQSINEATNDILRDYDTDIDLEA